LNNLLSYDLLGKQLDKLAVFSETDKALIYSKVKVMNLSPGEEFLKQGNLSNKMGFVTNGILRYFWVDKNKREVTAHFLRPNDFIADAKSFFNRVPSEGSIQAEMHCTLLVLDKKDYHEIESEVGGWHKAICSFTNHFLMDRTSIQRGIINGRAQESYEKLIFRHPEVAHNVPLGHIASYLGITQSTLSRIRKKMVKVAIGA